jgi:hypothetical protein
MNLAVNPGDHVTGKVTVNGNVVTVSLSDQTTGQSVTKTLQMDNPDTSSAEWIAEAPALESQGGTQILPLADFESVTFTGASATAGGDTGSISDPNWNVQQVDLGSGGGQFFAGGGQYAPAGLSDVAQTSTAGASAGAVSSDGTSFTVSYSSDGASAQSTGGTQPSDGTPPGGAYGYGYPGGYDYPGGYGDPGGYVYIYSS